MRSREIGWGNAEILLYEQTKQMKRLQEISSASAATNNQVIPEINKYVTDTTIPSGCRYVGISTSTGFEGTVLGEVIPGDYMIELKAPSNTVLGEVAIVVNGGECMVVTIK